MLSLLLAICFPASLPSGGRQQGAAPSLAGRPLRNDGRNCSDSSAADCAWLRRRAAPAGARNLTRRPAGSIREYGMRAQAEYLTRGRYVLAPGDYINIAFSGPDGFVVVSEPAGAYYVNVAADCADAAERRCRWYHTTIMHGYFLTGSAVAIGQITALTAGTFQLTVGYFNARCCEEVLARANGTWPVRWDVAPRASSCFVHTARTGALTMRDVHVGSDQSIRAYDFHSFQRKVKAPAPGIVFQEADGVGAFVLNNKEGSDSYQFSFGLALSDPDAAALDLDYLPASIATRLPLPSVMAGERHGYGFQTFAGGACMGVVCSEERTSFGGNTGGIPSTSDGDPVYEDLAPIATILTIAITMILLLAFVMTLLIFFWRRCRALMMRRNELPAEESALEDLNDEDEPPLAYPPAPPGFSEAPEISDPYAVAKFGRDSAHATPFILARGFDPPGQTPSARAVTSPNEGWPGASAPAWPLRSPKS
jgi:hypothetical protein